MVDGDLRMAPKTGATQGEKPLRFYSADMGRLPPGVDSVATSKTNDTGCEHYCSP